VTGAPGATPATGAPDGRPRLGVLGGMGPLASAEFVHTLYRLNMVEPEQGAPVCLLHSDPSIPDRTTALLAGDTTLLVARLARAVEELLQAGAGRVVIACVTAHAVLPELPDALREKVVPLLDLLFDELLAAPRPALLLATVGTRRARIFERHPRWNEVADWIGCLDDADQQHLHERLYRLKQCAPPADCLDWLDTLPAKYGRDTLLFGCTELHLLHRHREGRPACFQALDPLWIAARDARRLLGG
jgi:aspartate racemase